MTTHRNLFFFFNEDESKKQSDEAAPAEEPAAEEEAASGSAGEWDSCGDSETFSIERIEKNVSNNTA